MGMGDDGDVAGTALGCSVGSQVLYLKCHFRLGQAGELCKHLVQAMGRVSLGHPQPPGTTSTKLCSHRGTMHRAFPPRGSVPGSTRHRASPRRGSVLRGTVHRTCPPMGSASGHTMHADGLGHACLAALSAQQPAAPGAPFPQNGDRESCAPQWHSQQGLWLWPWGGGKDGDLLCTMLRGRGPVALSLQCHLSGLWRNEQDSLMEISAVRDDGDFQGKYLTRVTLASVCARVSPLKGAQQQPGEGGWPTFAFTVRWDKFSSKCWDTWGWHCGGTGSHRGGQQDFSSAGKSAG